MPKTHKIDIYKINNADYKNMSSLSRFTDTITECYRLYHVHGSRSSKKVDYFHNYLKTELELVLNNRQGYSVELETDVSCTNASGKKRCDVVIMRNGEPFIVFPIKLIMTNYKQNKNNYFENLTGEVMHLHWENPKLRIIPVNVFPEKLPYLTKDKVISKFETVETKDIDCYSILKDRGPCYDVVNLVINVEYKDSINTPFNSAPVVRGVTENTPFREFSDILNDLIN